MFKESDTIGIIYCFSHFGKPVCYRYKPVFTSDRTALRYALRPNLYAHY